MRTLIPTKQQLGQRASVSYNNLCSQWSKFPDNSIAICICLNMVALAYVRSNTHTQSTINVHSGACCGTFVVCLQRKHNFFILMGSGNLGTVLHNDVNSVTDNDNYVIVSVYINTDVELHSFVSLLFIFSPY